jgi:SAM-dependent methyltransferase
MTPTRPAQEKARGRKTLRARWRAYVQGPARKEVRVGETALDLGCGRQKHPLATGIDVNPNTEADVIHDLDVVPYPFADDTFDLVIAHHVLEHLERPLEVLQELHRICRSGARVDIVTPHFSSPTSWADPTHRHHFSSRSFDYLVAGTQYDFYSSARFRVARRRLVLGMLSTRSERVVPLLKLVGIEALVNRFIDPFERWWAFAAPLGPRDLCIELIVVK